MCYLYYYNYYFSTLNSCNSTALIILLTGSTVRNQRIKDSEIQNQSQYTHSKSPGIYIPAACSKTVGASECA
jgi:hypothetical protein